MVTSNLTGVLTPEREPNRIANPVNVQIKNTMMRVDGTKDNLSLQFMQGDDIACMLIRSFDDLPLARRIDSRTRIPMYIKHVRLMRTLVVQLPG